MEYDRQKTAQTEPVPASGNGMSGSGRGGLNALPIGTRLSEFEIIDLVGEGGFGIVYLAYDHSLDRHVALKEYMPSMLASRTRALYVAVNSQRQADTFTSGLRSFVNEARLLAQFDSPSLVKVYRFWEANGTAYMVMPFYEGVTLKQALQERRIVPDEEWIKRFLTDLLGAVDTIHRVQCYHRDIAPDNILLLKDGRPLLLDFGAARRVIGDLTQAPTIILKPGFAPIEQYADIPGLKQGAWTDVYGLAAVVYYLLAGKAPPAAVARVVKDDMTPARDVGKGRYSESFLAVIDKALAVKPENRIQSVTELRRALDLTGVPQPGPAPRPRTPPNAIPPRRPASSGTETGDDTEPTLTNWNTEDTTGRAVPGSPPGANTANTNANDSFIKLMNSDKRYFEDRQKRRKPPLVALGVLISVAVTAGTYWIVNYVAGPSPEHSLAVPEVASNAEPGSITPVPQPRGQAAEQPAPAPPAVAQAPVTPAVPPTGSGTASDTLGAYQKPNSVESGSARSKPEVNVPNVPPASTEDELWKSATASNQVGVYENYLKQYPRGRYASAARLRLDRLQPKTAQTQPGNTSGVSAVASSDSGSGTTPSYSDDELWRAVSNINEPPAYESYLRRFPGGRYAAEARSRLARLSPPASSAPSAPATAPPPTETAMIERNDQRNAAPRESDKPAPQPPPSEPMQSTAPALAPPASGKTLKLDGQTMTGDFTHDPVTGIVSGTGRIAWKNGDQFQGTLVRGIKEGPGQFTWSNGQRYTGSWSKDQPNGKGSFVFANGDRYEGDVKDGMPHGQGVTKYKGGDVYSGTWVRGKNHGKGRYTWANGGIWEGEFRDGQRTENGNLVVSEKAMATAGAGGGSSSGGNDGNREQQAATGSPMEAGK